MYELLGIAIVILAIFAVIFYIVILLFIHWLEEELCKVMEKLTDDPELKQL